MEEDEELLKIGEQRGFPDFLKIWEKYRKELYGICLKILNGCREDAEDVLSDAMLHAWDKLQTHAPRITNTKGWLLRLTHNFCIDRWRKYRNREMYDENAVANMGPNQVHNVYVNANFPGIPEDEFQREVILKKVYDLLEQLPERLREPAILRLFLEMPYRDIAGWLNLTCETARKRIQQVRAILKPKLNGIFGNHSLIFSFHWKDKFNGNSPTWQKLTWEAEKIFSRNSREIHFSFCAASMVRPTLASGIEKTMIIFLERKPTRLQLKIRTLQQYVAKYPTGWKKHMELAELYAALGEWQETINQLRRVVKLHPQDLRAWILLGQMLMRMGMDEEAVGIFERARPYAHRKSSAYYLTGMEALCSHRYILAAEAFKKASLMEPGSEIFQQSLGISFLQADCPVEALQAFETALDINGDDLVSLTYSYDLLKLTGRPAQAEKHVNRVLDIYPNDLLALKRKTDYRSRRGLVRGEDGKNTKKVIYKMKSLAPHIPQVYESMSIYDFYRGKWQKALALLKRAALEQPNCLCSWCYYSRWLYRTGAYKEAAVAILKAYQMDKKNVNVHLEACEILFYAGMHSTLKPFIENMLKHFPQRWSVCSTAGLVLITCFNRVEQACELSAQAVQLQPLLPIAYFQHGRILSLAGKHMDASEALKKGWELLPGSEDRGCVQSAAGAWLMAQCCQNLGDKAMSHYWLKKVIEGARKLKSGFPSEAHYWEAKALEALGEKKQAVTAFRNAIACHLFYPSRHEAQEALRVLENAPNRPHRGKQGQNSKNSQELGTIRLSIFNLN